MNVTNTHKTTLVLPNGQHLNPGQATAVRGWDGMKKNAVVAAWLRKGILVESEPAPVATSSADEKEELIARLAALGVKADKRKTVEKLQAMVVEAEAAANDGEDSGTSGDGDA